MNPDIKTRQNVTGKENYRPKALMNTDAKIKEKNYLIKPIDSVKAFDKIHHLFMIKTKTTS